jgi:hypothetical protein
MILRGCRPFVVEASLYELRKNNCMHLANWHAIGSSLTTGQSMICDEAKYHLKPTSFIMGHTVHSETVGDTCGPTLLVGAYPPQNSKFQPCHETCSRMLQSAGHPSIGLHDRFSTLAVSPHSQGAISGILEMLRQRLEDVVIAVK